MDPSEDIRRGLDGRKPRDFEDRKKPTKKTRTRESYPDRKPGLAPAGYEESQVAEAWMREAAQREYAVQFNANWLALQIAEKVKSDSEMSRYLERGKTEQVQRWLLKMVEVWWKEFTESDVNQRNAANFFLEVDWEEIRYYARISLRAAYLKDNGTWVQPPLITDQKEYHARLEEIRTQQKVRETSRRAEEHPVPQAELDTTRRERLRSWREKRRNK